MANQNTGIEANDQPVLNEKSSGRQFTDEELQDLVASTDSGARAPTSKVVTWLIAGVALAWSLFQLWIAEPQNWFSEYIAPLNTLKTRPIHLTFAIFLAFLAYPAFKKSPRRHVPIYDWLLAIIGAICTIYIFVFSDTLAETARVGDTTTLQVIIGIIGVVVLLEAARRSLGPALSVLALLFLIYAYMGQGWLIPEILIHEGKTVNRIVVAQWLTDSGVFGTPLGVSTTFVFLFVLFGSLLDKAGAGNYFIKLAFAGLGALRGGPAKAAVVGSAMTGLISGSSIANVVTTGTFTIPLMKRVGFKPEQAGAVEVASSVNGQIMPPVMGAAAFLMIEYVGISYLEVIKHAFIPAIISYIALVYIVHLEALKKDMPALGQSKNFLAMIIKFMVGFVVFGAAFTALIYGVGFLREYTSGSTASILIGAILLIYITLVWLAAKSPDLEVDNPNAKEIKLPTVGEIYATGLHYVLPILLLVWFLMVERQSPAKSAFYATAMMLLIIVTQKPLKAFFRGSKSLTSEFMGGLVDLREGLIAGARNMIGIGVATATAGIIVGSVSLTPIGQQLAGLVVDLSGGILIVMLLLIGLFSLILGMGLPTTANYIVVATLLAGVLVEVGAQEGLIIPLIAAHLFVFYFGIMADVTPPVGLASFAAAAVSGGNPIKTGFTAFFYSLRTVALPFLFIYNPALILYGVDLGTTWGILFAVKVFIVATFAMMLFAAATQGYFLAKSRIYESIALLLVAFTMFVPNFWLDRVQPPFREVPTSEFMQLVENANPGDTIRLNIVGPDDNGMTKTTFVMNIETEGTLQQRLDSIGLLLIENEEKLHLDEPGLGSELEEALKRFDFYADEAVQIDSVEVPASRLPQEVFYIPALALFGIIILLQRRRQTKPAF